MSVTWICSVCGYVHEGPSPPNACPSCGSPFTAFDRRVKDPTAKYRQVEVAEPRAPGFRYVIVGNSSAGRAAALAITSIDADGEVTVISEEQSDLYARPMLPDLIGGMQRERIFGVGGSFPGSGLQLILGDAAVRIDAAAKKVICASGREVAYDALLLATGSAPITVPWPGSDVDGIGYFRTIADADRISGWLAGAQHAVVVGGGLLGMEFVRAFHAKGVPITHLIRGNRVGVPALDEQAGEVIQRALLDWGVDLAFDDEVESFGSRNGRVSAVKTKKGRDIACDLVGVAIGVNPRTELAKQIGLSLDRGISVSARFETSIPGIYAAGDVAQAYDLVWGEPRVNTSWRNSRIQGEAAGIFMAGGAGEYPGAVGANYQLAAGLQFCAIGIANPPDPAGYQIEASQNLDARTYRKIVKRDGRVVGACLVGDLTDAPELEDAVQPRKAAPALVSAGKRSAKSDDPPKKRRRSVKQPSERRVSMHKMTEENAKAAFAGESQAHMRYMNFGKKADEEGKTNVARLFRAATFAEQVHAGRHLSVLSGVGTTTENLAAAIEGENFEATEMYPAYIAVADEQGESAASVAFNHALNAEVEHRELYTRAKKAVDAGGDISLADIWVCSNCGHTLEGQAPDTCPVCGHPKKDFVKF